MKKIKNYGVDLAKEKRDVSETDFILGGEGDPVVTGLADDIAGAVIALSAWPGPVKGIYQRTTAQINHCVCSWIKKLAKYYPVGEIQRGIEDYSDCVTRGFGNEIEKQLNYIVDNNLFSKQTINWLVENGYFSDDGKILLSNRVPAIMSGTTRYGNSLKAVIQWIENNGIHPRSMLSEKKKMTWNEYHNPSVVTQVILDVGKESKEYIKINYGRVFLSNFPKLFGYFKWRIFDNYLDRGIAGDFVKHLAEDYIFMSYGYKIVIQDLKKDKIMLLEKLEKYYSLIFHRPADEGAMAYKEYEDDFVLNELKKSEEWDKIDKILEWAKSSSFWKIFLPADLKGTIREWKELRGE